MKTIYLEQRSSTKGTEHNKFYEITDNGVRVLTRWGAIGTEGKEKLIFTSIKEEERDKVFNATLNKKLKKGYVPITDNGKQVEFRPSRNGRKWGVEIETHSELSLGDVVEKMRLRKLNVNKRAVGYFKSDGRQWDVKTDSSCGYEFASPILGGEAGYFEAKLAVEKIREVCPTAVNTKCGLHVTIDVSDFNKEELKKLIIKYLEKQEEFYSQCNKSRQNNKYCTKNPAYLLHMIKESNSIDYIIAAANPKGHYNGLNLERLKTKKVIEFRMMESTVGIRKVGAWIRFCVDFVDSVKFC